MDSNDPADKRTARLYLASSLAVLGFVGLLLIIAAGISAPTPSHNGTPEIVFPVSISPMGIYGKAAVAADNGHCSNIGKRMLLKGGSAADAAIAALICNGIVNMHYSGLGGGGFVVYWDSKTKSAHIFDAYAAAPRSAADMRVPSDQFRGGLSIGVPGHLAGIFELHHRFGRLPWKDLVQPSFELCENGFIIGPALADGIAGVETQANTTEFPEMQPLVDFVKKPNSSHFYRVNDRMKCLQLAKTHRILAEEGPLSIYNGTIANLLLEDFKEMNIPISQQELSAYQVNTTRAPFELELPNGLTIYTTRPSSGGAAAAFLLNVLSRYNFNSQSSQDLLTYHRYVEAAKFAYDQVYKLGDESFMDEVEVQALMDKLASSAFAEHVRKLINDDHVSPFHQYLLGADFSAIRQIDEKQSTTHISVLDGQGSAISMTTTVNNIFGSYVMSPRTGIVLNNVIGNFYPPDGTYPPWDPFRIEPGKRAPTCMSPMIFVDHSTSDPEFMVKLIVGASGSKRIMSTVSYVAMRILCFGETAKQAVDAGRLANWLYPDRLNYEDTIPEIVLEFLKDRGNVNQAMYGSRYSACQTIHRLPNRTIHAISDYRKERGYTAGY